MMHYLFMIPQSLVLASSKMTSSRPSQGQFSGKIGIFPKVWIFQNPFCHMLETLKKWGGWRSWFIADLWCPKSLLSTYVVKWPVLGLQKGSANSPLAPSNSRPPCAVSVLVLMHLYVVYFVASLSAQLALVKRLLLRKEGSPAVSCSRVAACFVTLY